MFIKLKKNWFGPEGTIYRSRTGLHEVSEEIAAVAPSTTLFFDKDGKKIDRPKVTPVAPKPPEDDTDAKKLVAAQATAQVSYDNAKKASDAKPDDPKLKEASTAAEAKLAAVKTV